jgi:hypothetical protein
MLDENQYRALAAEIFAAEMDIGAALSTGRFSGEAANAAPSSQWSYAKSAARTLASITSAERYSVVRGCPSVCTRHM